ncbi:tetratricopeptide repeat protein [Rhodocyclus tenuis]|uniref:Tetratricopeptide repeat protein n=1 Tax=Rhodocyclus gracilis TaxID=2929842 RepID=A0ABX0WJ91_9RHOO|nr:tetratricopeptide repeat protein [Rhodocyclus gracilis]NJA88518.1 tetratricopeptide repeat protein [Rhodocyclus gracilis]
MTQPHDDAEQLFFAGNQRLQEGDAAHAEAHFRAALALRPDFAEALANLAFLREQAGAPAEAEHYYRQTIALLPDCLQPYLNLSSLLLDGRRFADAEALLRQAQALAPTAPAVWSNLGALHACLHEDAAAEACYRAALRLDPEHTNSRFNLSYLLLRQGRFAEGWEAFEARDWYGVLTRHFLCPRWQGEPLQGKSILLGIEAGHGDMIQFARYASLLKAAGARHIAIVCHPALKALFARLRDADEILAFDEDIPRDGWDYWTPALSLPYYCQTRAATIPAPIPYLSADPQRVAYWAPRLPVRRAGGEALVGLVWKGSVGFENDTERSLPALATLAPLARVGGIRFVSLQKGQGEDEAHRPPDGMDMTPLGESLADFADTCAVIDALDLVIAVDTAVAHLAGAMGKPCWLLLPDYRTDWRWLTEREDSPWYPGRMRLFRQAAGRYRQAARGPAAEAMLVAPAGAASVGDSPAQRWAPVIERVADALAEWRMNFSTASA